MKKRVIFLAMSVCIMMLAWGCSSKEVGEDKATTDSTDTTDTTDTKDEVIPTETDETAGVPTKEEYDVSEFITLGEYKGIEVTVEQLEVTEENINTAIKADLDAAATEEEVTDRAVQQGDIVNMDYEGLKDGVAFEGGTAKAADLEIGSGRFIPGFEEGLVGAKVGDELAINVTFPEVYDQSPDLAGQPVVFNVKVNSIKVSVVPELTEEYVKTNTDYETIEAYKEATRAEIQAANENTMKNSKINSILSQIVANSTISSYPQTLIDYYAFEMESYYAQYASMFGYELVDFLAANGLTEEGFATEKQTYAEDRSAQELVLNAIIKAEKMELTDEEYTTGVAAYVTDYGYASEEEFLQNVTEEQIRESLIWEKAVDFISEQAVEL